MNKLKPITLCVPFVYEAIVIKPRHRKPSLISIKDELEISILRKDTSELPIAFKVGRNAIRFDGQRLWDFKLESIADKPSRTVSIDEVIKNTESNGTTYKWSRAGAAAPFKNFWSDLSYSQKRLGPKHGISETSFNACITDKSLVEKSNAVYREWAEDNRQVVVDRLTEIVDSLLVVDDVMYCTAGEPRYEVMSFGAGHNYSVAMFIAYRYNPNVSGKSYFNALDYDKAKASLFDRCSRKRERGIAIPNCGNLIEVLIEDAVKCNPLAEHPL